VYVTGRTTKSQRSEYNRPETIEETAELVTQAGGQGIAVQVDHFEANQVKELVNRIENEVGRLDLLVNDIWGGEQLAKFDVPIWAHSLEDGLRVLKLAIDTHIITSRYALPLLIRNRGGLLIEVTDGTTDYNKDHYRCSLYYDLAKISVNRMGWSLAKELEPYGCTSLSLTPGWLRSEMMLDGYGVTEENWRDALKRAPEFGISESPHYVGRAVAHLAADDQVSRFNGHSLSSEELAKIYNFTDLDGSQPECWRYNVEVKEGGKKDSIDNYR
jgi:NAD(P)-dependent dehydrogenase (short-subunit alcohol dehydrogenase family)